MLAKILNWNSSLKTKLSLSLFLLSIFCVALVGYSSYRTAKISLTNQIFNNLSLLRQNEKTFLLNSFFNSVASQDDLKNILVKMNNAQSINLAGYETYLVDGKGQIISQDNQKKGLNNSLPVEKCKFKNEINQIYFNYQDVEVVGASACLPDNWTLLIEKNSVDAFSELELIKLQILISVLLILIVVVILIYFLSRKIIDPINRLALTARSISDGQLNARAEDFSESELKTLSSSFNQMTEKLISSNEQIKSLVNIMPAALLIFNQDLKVFNLNESALKLLKLKKEKILNQEIATLFKDGFKRIVIQKFIAQEQEIDLSSIALKAINEDKIEFFDDIAFKDGFFEIFIAPIKDYSGKIIAGALVFHDITKLKEVNKIKSEFISIASHQLRTPLTSIRLFIEILLSEQAGKLNKDQKDYLNNLHKSTQAMVQLANDLLSLSRMESGRLKFNFEDFDLNVLLKDILAEASSLALEKKCRLIYKNKINLPIVCDKNLLRQVIHNLISNSIRYSQEKNGKVLIEVKKEVKYYLIQVEDNGIGIPKELQKKIFTKFYRAGNAIKTAPDGSGLGLFVAKTTIENLGGKIWFKSEENKGTSFFIKIPRMRKKI